MLNLSQNDLLKISFEPLNLDQWEFTIDDGKNDYKVKKNPEEFLFLLDSYLKGIP